MFPKATYVAGSSQGMVGMIPHKPFPMASVEGIPRFIPNTLKVIPY